MRGGPKNYLQTTRHQMLHKWGSVLVVVYSLLALEYTNATDQIARFYTVDNMFFH